MSLTSLKLSPYFAIRIDVEWEDRSWRGWQRWRTATSDTFKKLQRQRPAAKDSQKASKMYFMACWNVSRFVCTLCLLRFSLKMSRLSCLLGLRVGHIFHPLLGRNVMCWLNKRVAQGNVIKCVPEDKCRQFP